MARLSAIFLASVAAAGARVSAQDEAPEPDDELLRPPRIEAELSPGDARLEPPAEQREDMLEAVVTGGQTDFRLPDLGTSFRSAAEDLDSDQRIEVRFLNLYDPENRDPAEEAFPSLEEKLGVGMLRVFRIQFGHRDRDSE